jgi:hypothetical protein
MRRKIAIVLAAGVLGGGAAAMTASAGQPGVSCQNTTGATQPNPPPGQTSPGFQHASTTYAGNPGNPSSTNGNAHAVSQYDVSCFGGRAR